MDSSLLDSEIGFLPRGAVLELNGYLSYEASRKLLFGFFGSSEMTDGFDELLHLSFDVVGI